MVLSTQIVLSKSETESDLSGGKVRPKYRGDRTYLVFHKGCMMGAYSDKQAAQRMIAYRADMFGEGCTMTTVSER